MSKQYSLAVQEIEVEIDGVPHVLVEAGVDDLDAMRAELWRSKDDASGHPRFATAEADLVAACLFVKDGKRPVSKEVVRQWPWRVVKGLHDDLEAMSGLKPKGAEEAKNSPGAAAK